jgi:hypothetical protein
MFSDWGSHPMRDWAKLHADISKSRSFAAVCNERPEAGLVFLMMLPRADILGIVDAHPVVFRGEVCPLLNLTEAAVEACLQILQRHDMLVLYEDPHGDRWGWVRNWAKYQDVRWTHVGPTHRPLPDCWESPEGLDEHLQKVPDSAFSRATVELRSRYCSTTKSCSASLPSTVADQSTEYREEESTEESRDSAPDSASPRGGEHAALTDRAWTALGLAGKTDPRLYGFTGKRKQGKGLRLFEDWVKHLEANGPLEPFDPTAEEAEWFKVAYNYAMGCKPGVGWRKPSGGNGPAPEPDGKLALYQTIPEAPPDPRDLRLEHESILLAIAKHPRHYDLPTWELYTTPQVATRIGQLRRAVERGEL